MLVFCSYAIPAMLTIGAIMPLKVLDYAPNYALVTLVMNSWYPSAMIFCPEEFSSTPGIAAKPD